MSEEENKPSIEDLVTDEKLQKTIEGLKEEIPDVDTDEFVKAEELDFGDSVSREVAEQIKHLADPEACDDDACANLREQFGIVAEGDDHDHDHDADDDEEADADDADAGEETETEVPDDADADGEEEDEDSGEWHGWD